VEAGAGAPRPRHGCHRASLRPLLPLDVERHRPLQLPVLHRLLAGYACRLHFRRRSGLAAVPTLARSHGPPARDRLEGPRLNGVRPPRKHRGGHSPVCRLARLLGRDQPDDDRVLPQPVAELEGEGAWIRELCAPALTATELPTGPLSEGVLHVRVRSRRPTSACGLFSSPRRLLCAGSPPPLPSSALRSPLPTFTTSDGRTTSARCSARILSGCRSCLSGSVRQETVWSGQPGCVAPFAIARSFRTAAGTCRKTLASSPARLLQAPAVNRRSQVLRIPTGHAGVVACSMEWCPCRQKPSITTCCSPAGHRSLIAAHLPSPDVLNAARCVWSAARACAMSVLASSREAKAVRRSSVPARLRRTGLPTTPPWDPAAKDAVPLDEFMCRAECAVQRAGALASFWQSVG